ncbi:hypothetical protein [Streptomyces poonensis]|uniref:Uncharacterized protein n=1 Tax=Streptomyces poonensis TaxID=68255 RepID=A0A918QC05_9ACTN|nr:hypothetical protein [Streptomyces poonensis]GGZ40532.1 hypothetical protein GCM10010365_71610 [Streptomyces poonensis]GLJ93038.1 hypothetical protein GCM10017589_56500 [Streptomyces poonensis]
MKPTTEPITITRGQGGQVEVEGVLDSFAAEVLRRAGFLFEPTLRGHWIRLPFDLGRDWENEHATWAAGMLTAARYPVRLDPDLRADVPEQAPPPGASRPPAMTALLPGAAQAADPHSRRSDYPHPYGQRTRPPSR